MQTHENAVELCARERPELRGGLNDVGIGVQRCFDARARRIGIEDPEDLLIDELAAQQHAIVIQAFFLQQLFDLDGGQRGQSLPYERSDLLVGDAPAAGLPIARETVDKSAYPLKDVHAASLDFKPVTPPGRKPDHMVVAVLVGLFAAGALAALAMFALRYLHEREELHRLRALFSRYVPEHVVDEILARRDLRLLWAQRHYATVLCCRIRNFGFFSEDLSAEETLRHLNEFYAVAGRAIVRHGGVIERLHADGITAVFGVLTSDTFQEERALRAALLIIRLANAMNSRWQAMGRRPFQVYAGVNSGPVVAGEVGFAQRREFAIVGHPAHVAARLQQAAEDINAYILTTAATYEPVAEQFVALPINTLPLPGLRKLQKAYIIRGLTKRSEEELLHLPPEISALQTVVEPAAAASPAAEAAHAVPASVEPSAARFSSVDNALPAMPDLPPVSGEYEPPKSW